MKLQKYTLDGIVVGESIFLKDKPAVFEVDGILSINLDFKKAQGSFHAPSSNFGGPQIGDLIDVKMNSGKVLRSVVTFTTQTNVSRTGTTHLLGYVEDFQHIIQSTKIE